MDETEKWLRNMLDVQKENMIMPSPSERLRKTVAARKQKYHEKDLLETLTSFLNMRIKLYHAIGAAALVWGLIVFFGQEKASPQQTKSYNEEQSQLASAGHQTVLPSINTFLIKR